MAKPALSSLPLFERAQLSTKLSIIIRRALDVTILCLFLCLLIHRLHSLGITTQAELAAGFISILAFLCESCFAFIWLLNLTIRWSPVDYNPYPQNLLSRLTDDELPPVDMFVTTADPLLEPPLVTMNTVLSLLAVDYPAEKLACYVSDDACSALTFHSLVQASNFAKLWVPFCNKYNVQDEYEQLCGRIEDAAQNLQLGPHSAEYAAFHNLERNDHPSIVKVIWENNIEDKSRNALPRLVYISREKRPNHPHHYKAGAMNVLTRVSGVMTNAPFMLNVDCDMFVSNPRIIVQGVCFLVGVQNEQDCAFVQCPQIFYNALKDDPFGNQMFILFAISGSGMNGIQGPPYAGTGCFHRRKTIYGFLPNHDVDRIIKDGRVLKVRFGDSEELSESVAEALCGSRGKKFPCHISSSIESACRVAGCTYENNTCWGTEVGLMYGSATEDILTGLRIHKMGWKSVWMVPNPPGFMGCVPPSLPITMTQMKRWGTGLLEVLFSKHFPILPTFSSNLQFRQALAYCHILLWAFRPIPEFCYVTLFPYSIITNSHFLPKLQEPGFYVCVSLFLIFNLQSLSHHLQYGESIRAWWNWQRMSRISTPSSHLFAWLSIFIKLLGLSETVFEITQKSTGGDDENDGEKVGRFTFDESPMFVPVTACLLVHSTALAMWLLGLQPPARGGDGCGLAEVAGSVWMVLSFWPFVRGLVGEGKYGIPWSTVCKSAALALLYVQLARRCCSW